MQTVGTVKSLGTQEDQYIYFPYTICFVDCEPSEAVRFQIEEHLARLEHFYSRITDCRVNVRIPHKRGARFFHIHIQLDVPGKRLAVSREPETKDEHTTVSAAIRDAFHKVVRQLEDFTKARAMS